MIDFEDAKKIALRWFCGREMTEQEMKEDSGYSIMHAGDNGNEWVIIINQIHPEYKNIIPGLPTILVDKENGEIKTTDFYFDLDNPDYFKDEIAYINDFKLVKLDQ